MESLYWQFRQSCCSGLIFVYTNTITFINNFLNESTYVNIEIHHQYKFFLKSKIVMVVINADKEEAWHYV